MLRPHLIALGRALILSGALSAGALAQVGSVGAGGGAGPAGGAEAKVETASRPGAGESSGLVTVQAGDTAYSIARRAGLSVEQLLALNGLSQPQLRVGQVLRVRNLLRHTVQPGETLYALARRYSVSVDDLLTENALTGGAVLKVGQLVKLPAWAKAPAAPGQPLAAQPPTTQPPTTQPPINPPLGALPATPPPTPAAGPGRLALGGVGGSPFLPTAPIQVAPALGVPVVLPVLDPASSAPAPATPVSSTPAPFGSAPSGPALSPPAPPAFTLPPAPLPTDWRGSDWRGAALAMLGTPYVYGGASRTGTDCSGLVLQVFTPLGFKLPRVSADQAQVGTPVQASELQPGDLVFFDTEGRGRVSHVGIYLGEDSFVNANSYQGKVVIDRLMADRYWAPRYLGARRILGQVLTQRP